MQGCQLAGEAGKSSVSFYGIRTLVYQLGILLSLRLECQTLNRQRVEKTEQKQEQKKKPKICKSEQQKVSKKTKRFHAESDCRSTAHNLWGVYHGGWAQSGQGSQIAYVFQTEKLEAIKAHVFCLRLLEMFCRSSWVLTLVGGDRDEDSCSGSIALAEQC